MFLCKFLKILQPIASQETTTIRDTTTSTTAELETAPETALEAVDEPKWDL